MAHTEGARALPQPTACAGPTTSNTCRWTPTTIDGDALTQGFGTRGMEMHLQPAPHLGFTWTNPRQALFVACAVFTCSPGFIAAYSYDTSDGSHVPQQIANHDACILALHATDALPEVSQQALMVDGSWLPAASSDDRGPSPIYDRVIDFVAGGCWAYDASSIIAASDLVPIRVADVAAALPNANVPVDARCSSEGDTCYHAGDSGHAFFGACVAGICQPRCMTAADCETAAKSLLGQPRNDMCAWDCREVPNSLARVCVPLAE